jgi:hypothetical protein
MLRNMKGDSHPVVLMLTLSLACVKANKFGTFAQATLEFDAHFPRMATMLGSTAPWVIGMQYEYSSMFLRNDDYSRSLQLLDCALQPVQKAPYLHFFVLIGLTTKATILIRLERIDEVRCGTLPLPVSAMAPIVYSLLSPWLHLCFVLGGRAASPASVSARDDLATRGVRLVLLFDVPAGPGALFSRPLHRGAAAIHDLLRPTVQPGRGAAPPPH